ncbi:MAG: putative membrane protein YwzB [Gammaproteobacteria bacterium]|jgi:uncharacterized membrane protein YwzB
MNTLGYVSIVLGIAAVALIWLTLDRIKHRKFIASGFYGCQSLLMLFMFVSLLLLFSNLNTYYRLTAERDIADILVTKIADQQYQITLIFDSNQIKKFVLSGDEWQLDARIVKWKGWANLLGLDSYYQLDRLSGRFRNIAEANGSQSTAYQISAVEKGLSIWKLKRVMGSKLAFLDTYFGQSVFMPMRHLAKYKVSISQVGLVARPANEVANQAMTAW